MFTLPVVWLFWACGLLMAAIPACQDDSVYRSGDVPPSTMDGGGTGGAAAGSDAGAD